MRCAPRLGSADRRAGHHRDLAADDGEEHGIAVRAAEREQEQRGTRRARATARSAVRAAKPPGSTAAMRSRRFTTEKRARVTEALLGRLSREPCRRGDVTALAPDTRM